VRADDLAATPPPAPSSQLGGCDRRHALGDRSRYDSLGKSDKRIVREQHVLVIAAEFLDYETLSAGLGAT
jgi:hypothetical protein